MSLNTSDYEHLRHFFASREIGMAGISGGRTSAMMAAFTDDRTVLAFQNTGREHPGTYDFLHELEQRLLPRKLIWLEFRKPRKKGDRPRNFEYAVVDYKTADRSGGPFSAFLEALAEYRVTKGENPPEVAPWAMQRICTAYMKTKVAARFAAHAGMDTYEQFIGLRHDEPERVHRLKRVETRKLSFRTPLFDAGIKKNDVLEFWSKQDFDLRIREEQGNCTACFLKDYGDISRVLGEDATDAAWWLNIEKRFPNFGGQNFPGYRVLAAQREVRLRIESQLRAGVEPTPEGDHRAFKLLVRQERRRLTETSSFSCSCEASQLQDEEDGD